MARLVTMWVALALFIAFAGAVLLHDEVASRRDKVVRVFELATEYRTTLGATNQTFSDRWNEFYNDSVDTYNGNLDEQAYAQLVTRFLQADSNRNNYETLAGFYESVGDCVKERLCDFWSARATFGNDIKTFYDNMYPELVSECQQGRNCDGLFQFVNRLRDADRGAEKPGWVDNMTEWAY